MREAQRLLHPEVGAWLAGFTDGEGCFFIGNAGACSFHIKLRADDREILEKIKGTIGHGRIDLKEPNGVGGRQPQAHYSVTTKAGCLRVADLFHDFRLRSKKRRDFEVWAVAVELWNIGGARSEEMDGYRRQLREGRAYRDLADNGVAA
jgi:hypothetical protein